MVTEDILYRRACNIYKKGFWAPCESVSGSSEGWILSRSLSVFITSSKCHCFSWSVLPILKPHWDMCNCCVPATCTCNCNLLSACPRDKHYACQASYLDNYSTNMEDSRPPISLICSLLDPAASLDGEGEAGRWPTLCLCGLKMGQLQPQHTPAWLSASERRVPLLRSLRRKSSCGSAADVCGDTASAW